MDQREAELIKHGWLQVGAGHWMHPGILAGQQRYTTDEAIARVEKGSEPVPVVAEGQGWQEEMRNELGKLRAEAERLEQVLHEYQKDLTDLAAILIPEVVAEGKGFTTESLLDAARKAVSDAGLAQRALQKQAKENQRLFEENKSFRVGHEAVVRRIVNVLCHGTTCLISGRDEQVEQIVLSALQYELVAPEAAPEPQPEVEHLCADCSHQDIRGDQDPCSPCVDDLRKPNFKPKPAPEAEKSCDKCDYRHDFGCRHDTGCNGDFEHFTPKAPEPHPFDAWERSVEERLKAQEEWMKADQEFADAAERSPQEMYEKSCSGGDGPCELSPPNARKLWNAMLSNRLWIIDQHKQLKAQEESINQMRNDLYPIEHPNRKVVDESEDGDGQRTNP